MIPSKIEADVFQGQNQTNPNHERSGEEPVYPKIVVFEDELEDPSSEDLEDPTSESGRNRTSRIDPTPHVSSQFYTFNAKSHSLMSRCLLSSRLATPQEIRSVTPSPVLATWRSVWKDRSEDTAYVTAWKRMQDKLVVHPDPTGSYLLTFKNNLQQQVSHTEQWEDIVTGFHTDSDFNHLCLKDTLERIKQVWTVGAKLYGIPESFIRSCISSCPLCSGSSSLRNKRRRFEYTESIDVPARDVPQKLQHLAAKHKVVLCICQKYIRYKPFMAEIKDYACHRAGHPTLKKSRVPQKREPYASKRCGCGFRIRAIVPISNYNDKDKSFVYEDQGTAVFKLYAVHSGHEPGASDGNARIIHRAVGHNGGFFLEDSINGNSDDTNGLGLHEGSFGLLEREELHSSVLQQVQDIRTELGLLESRAVKIRHELLGSVSRELFDVLMKVKSIGCSDPVGLISHSHDSDDVLAQWVGKGGRELIDDDDNCFEQTLGNVATWDHMETECRIDKDVRILDEKGILGCEDSKLTKPMQHHESMPSDVGLSIHVDSFYPESSKWYDSPCEDCGDGRFID